MDKNFIAKMSNRLNEIKAEIIETLVAESEDFEAIIKDMDPKDLADIAADDIDRSTLEAVSNQDIRRLRQIDSVAYIRFASVYRDFSEAKDFEEFAHTVHEAAKDGGK